MEEEHQPAYDQPRWHLSCHQHTQPQLPREGAAACSGSYLYPKAQHHSV